MIQKVGPIFGLLCVLAVCGCMGGGLNSDPPDYIKAIHACKDVSDGLSICFILADKNGEMTTSYGRATLEIIDPEAWPLSSQVLLRNSANVSRSDFQKAKLNIGKFEPESIIYNMSRITYSNLSRKPSGNICKLKITFVTPDNRTLEGEEEIFWQSPDPSISREAPYGLGSFTPVSGGDFEGLFCDTLQEVYPRPQ